MQIKKKDKHIIIRIDEELQNWFKVYCSTNRTTMSAKLLAYIVKVHNKEKNGS